MCTLSYLPEVTAEDGARVEAGSRAGARRIFFNRDELLSRAPARAPAQFRGRGGVYLMPVDPDSGGSWMGLHSAGFFVCLLNNYPPASRTKPATSPTSSITPITPASPPSPPSPITPGLRSRGLLIRDILEMGRLPDIELLRTGLDCYKPFFLAFLSREESRIWEWDGIVFRPVSSGAGSSGAGSSGAGMLSSSSFEPERVLAARRRCFEGLPGHSAAALRRFHRHRGRRPDEGVLMRRSDACTVSISEICLDREGGSIRYYGAAPFIRGRVNKLTQMLWD